MSKLICPFCNSELHKDSDGYYTCYTDNCGCMKYGGNGASGSESLWLALIRTRKALEMALDWLGQVATPEKCDDDLCREFTKRKLTEIKTALEQKE